MLARRGGPDESALMVVGPEVVDKRPMQRTCSGG
jgi:hypothetical protein